MATTIPLALYVHTPWCERKCPYCDFNSHNAPQSIPEKTYIDALIADLNWELQQFTTTRQLHSIFIGGGTPSLFSPQSIATLLTAIQQHIDCKPNLEITLEANPGTVDYAKFQGFRQSGINRLSIGIQSFNNQHLQKLGRIHDQQQALNAIEYAQQANFASINLDLMYGLPQQTLDQAKADIQQAINCQPQHISLYQLTIEPNTWFHHQPPTLPKDDAIWDSQQQCQQLLHEANYQQYEISAYAQPEYQCQHNINYWQFGDYLGIGAGAHSKLTTHDTIKRHSKRKQPKDYMQHAGSTDMVDTQQIIQQDLLILEFMMNALRLKSGFNPSLFYQRTGLSIDILKQSMQPALAQKLLHWHHQHIQPTTLGWQYLDDVLQLFMPP